MVEWSREGDYHPQYSGYSPGEAIKQVVREEDETLDKRYDYGCVALHISIAITITAPFHQFTIAPYHQADAILLGFPLLVPMAESTRRHDLQLYGKMVGQLKEVQVVHQFRGFSS